MAYIDGLCKTHEFVLIQEHWLFVDNIDRVQNDLTDILCHGTSGMDASIHLIGQPYGGCVILWHKNIGGTVTPINTNSKRLCAVIYKYHGGMILIMNVYMPPDAGLYSINDDYKEVLDEVAAILTCHDGIPAIIGDFNTDFRRTWSQNTISLAEFIDQNLRERVASYNTGDQFTYESMANDSRSYIDHRSIMYYTMSTIICQIIILYTCVLMLMWNI